MDVRGFHKILWLSGSDLRGFHKILWFSGSDLRGFHKMLWLATTVLAFVRAGLGFFKEHETTAFRRFGFSFFLDVGSIELYAGRLKSVGKS